MKKKITVLILGAVFLAVSFPAKTQLTASKVPRVGYLALSRSAGTDAFLQGLKDLGYVEGQNVTVEYRFAEGNEERYADLAAELVQLNVEVIVLGGTAAARAVRRLTKTIPIVLPDSADPVAAGLVETLSHPGGNVTGLTIMCSKLNAKRLELLKESMPTISRIFILVRGRSKKGTMYTPFNVSRNEIEITARSLEVRLQYLPVLEVNQIEKAFSVMTNKRPGAFILIPNPMFTYERKRIVDMASQSRLPGIYPHRGFVETGGLMSYAANNTDLFRRAASYVDKILKGANPADLPVEQPRKFELVINLKTAKQIGITIPAQVLMWAAKVIK